MLFRRRGGLYLDGASLLGVCCGLWSGSSGRPCLVLLEMADRAAQLPGKCVSGCEKIPLPDQAVSIKGFQNKIQTVYSWGILEFPESLADHVRTVFCIFHHFQK